MLNFKVDERPSFVWSEQKKNPVDKEMFYKKTPKPI